MRRTMRWLSTALAALVVSGLLLSAAPGASAAQIRRRVIVVEPFYRIIRGAAIRMLIPVTTHHPTMVK